MKKFLENYKKLVILGIGNEIRGDDSLGSVIAQRLSKFFDGQDDVVVLDGGTVPENYTSLIRRENPTHIILFDAVDMKKKPGFVRIVKKEEITSYNISTHAMPLSFLIKYLESTTGAKIILIGIQPKNLDITQTTSKEVEESIENVVSVFDRLIRTRL